MWELNQLIRQWTQWCTMKHGYVTLVAYPVSDTYPTRILHGYAQDMYPICIGLLGRIGPRNSRLDTYLCVWYGLVAYGEERTKSRVDDVSWSGERTGATTPSIYIQQRTRRARSHACAAVDSKHARAGASGQRRCPAWSRAWGRGRVAAAAGSDAEGRGRKWIVGHCRGRASMGVSRWASGPLGWWTIGLCWADED
jgi:hypothetical protein